MQQQLSDTELISKVLNGDTSAYSALIRIHQRFVFTLALRFSKNREDAEEIAQDSFIKAYRSLHTFKQSSKFSTWLYSIVYTTSMTFLRKSKLLLDSIDDPGNKFVLETPRSGYSSDETEAKSTKYYLNLAISQLSETDALVITLFYLAEQNLEEIAFVLKIEPNNVKVRLHRARQRLKEKLSNILHHEINELL